MKQTKKVSKKVLILGSGALKIGQAGEFDYSGSQAIKAFKEEGIQTILINPNIATIQTSEELADRVYFLPVDEYFVEKVIEKERPDSIALSFGGQTALNCGMNLSKKGVLKKQNVQVLGTPVSSIIISEDRDKFAKHLKKIDVPIPESHAASTVDVACKIAESIGFPVMIRAAFALGGQNSGVAKTEDELEKIVSTALIFSPQVLIEQYLHHYKEIEYEVVRDQFDNCVTVCNMENMDPLGIHTGESIVVAPSQTLTNFEYHYLRAVAIKIVRSLNIVGECNVQFALNPKPKIPNPKKGQNKKYSNSKNFRNSDLEIRNYPLEYYVIELNPRLSRSSALASKATGYPLAYIAAKLSLGKSLMAIQNQVTRVTQSFFEPALDYLVVKIPRWDLEKFKGVEEKIGSSMKSVGEVMAIGRTFEEAIQKAVRMLDIGAEGVTENNFPRDNKKLMHYVKTPTPKRLFALVESIARGVSISKLYTLTGIDPWFLYRLENIVRTEKSLKKTKKLAKDTMLSLKQRGFSDKKIGQIVGSTELEIRTKRKQLGIVPSVFQIDTLAAEFPAQTNYLYMTYNGTHHDVKPLDEKGVIVLGSGPYRIGSSVEFDWTCVHTAFALKKFNKRSIIVNCNPETVSTDYDISNRLYFEEITFERVADIYEFENPYGTIVSVGGQTPNNIVKKLYEHGVQILGTSAENIDRAEDRNKFSKLLDTLAIPQPDWTKVTSIRDAVTFAQTVGFPVLIRPSYVLSGSAMSVCYTPQELKIFTQKATIINREYPVTISKFINDAKEIELDAVAQNGKIKVMAVSEHIEHAGVHSGDASIVYPPQKLYLQTEKTVKEIGAKVAAALEITGPFNIQFLAQNNKVYVIEINLRASRTFPFISKIMGINFAEALVSAFFGNGKTYSSEYPTRLAVKVPQFSFSRLEGADPILRVEMASTGEAACFGDTVEEAFLKAEMSVGTRVPKKGIFLSLGGDENKIKFLDSALSLQTLGVPLYATERTAKFLKQNGVAAHRLYKIHEQKKPNILTYFQKGKIDFAINIPDLNLEKDISDYYIIRRSAIDNNISLITNRQKAALFIKALIEQKIQKLPIKSWSEYI